jgi:hypothetical protein
MQRIGTGDEEDQTKEASMEVHSMLCFGSTPATTKDLFKKLRNVEREECGTEKRRKAHGWNSKPSATKQN